MNPDYMVVLYSKYSSQCQRVLNVYNDTMDFVKLVCVDNADVRQQVMTSKTLQLKSVPCIVLVFPNGTIEKYEGEGMADTILEQIAQNTPQQITPIENLPQMQVSQPTQQQPIQAPQPVASNPPQTTPIEDLDTDGFDELKPTNILGNAQDIEKQRAILDQGGRPAPKISSVAAEMKRQRDEMQSTLNPQLIGSA